MEKEELKRARKIWINEHDANKAYLHVEKINCVEKFLLKGLSQSGKNDFLGAFQNVSLYFRVFLIFISSSVFDISENIIIIRFLVYTTFFHDSARFTIKITTYN